MGTLSGSLSFLCRETLLGWALVFSICCNNPRASSPFTRWGRWGLGVGLAGIRCPFHRLADTLGIPCSM